MKRVIHPICAGLLCICWTFAVFGQQPTKSPASVPRLVKFSGTLIDGGGKPLAGVAGVTFSLYEEPDGGAPIWMETQNVQADGNGQYTAMLGSTRNDGIPAEVFASGQGRWLGVQPQGEAERPRVLLTSVPYALKAVDAETLGGLPASAFALAGTTATTPEHGVVSGVSQSEAAASIKTAGVKPLFTTTGTTNFIPKFTDAFGDIGNSGLYQNGGNIGLGTTAAAIPFDIRPTPGAAYAQLGVAQTVDYMTLFASDKFGPAFYWDPTKALRFGKGGTGLYSSQGFGEFMRIQPNGYVGIGTETPAATLDVMGNINSSGMFLIGANPVLISGASMSSLFVGLQNGGVNSYRNTGSQNTFIGAQAGANNTTANYNTFVGASSGFGNSTGSNNVFLGHAAGTTNSSGTRNTFAGDSAGVFNIDGNDNTLFGANAGGGMTEGGSANTVVGSQAAATFGFSGSNNTFMGYNAGFSMTSGGENVFVGSLAGYGNTTGGNNTFVGIGAGEGNSTGNYNTFIGPNAGVDNSTGSYDVYISSVGTYPDESNAIRIGDPNYQTSAFIAGIYNNNISGAVVQITASGQLGITSSSRRYKEDIQDMGNSSSELLRLRPVTFRYKKPFEDGSKPVQYGLIAEEVAEVYPDLVARSADGQIETVKYQLLDSMLLNELQKQNATIAAQKERIRSQEQRINSLEERLARVEAALGGAAVTAAAR